MIPLRILCLALTGVLLFGAGARADDGEKLDIGAYLVAADRGIVYPSQAQLDMLKPFVPAARYRPAPPIGDRVFWERIGQKESAREIIQLAREDRDKKPEVPITDEVYRRANKEGNRGIYKPRYYRTMGRLENAVIAECVENQGRYLPQIVEHAEAILAMKSWLHPNHDRNNDVLEGRRVDIDLGARKFASVLMLTDLLLEDKLSPDLRAQIKEQIEGRITQTYLWKCRGEDRVGIEWQTGTSNWNSVCTGGAVFSVLTASEDHDERLAVLGSALNSMKHYLSGFGDDGYCSEGVGYWRYGFGNYLYLAQMIYDYTDGEIDLFAFENPAKMARIGNFPANFEIQNDIYPCFADGGAKIKAGSDNFAYLLSAKHYGAAKPTYSRPADITMRIMEWIDPVSYVDPGRPSVDLPPHSYFKASGMVISRGPQEVPFSIAIKAGHNAENHNHSDVGSYLMVLGDDFIMSGDLGAPPYKAGAFSPDHKVRSSWGHPVPRVDRTLQSNGRSFHGRVLEADFSEKRDRVVMDLAPAYEVAALEKLVRTMENNKSGFGTITIRDEFEASEPIAFDTAIMTHAEYRVVDKNTVLLMREGKTIRVEIASKGGAFVIKGQKVPVEDIRYAPAAFKIGIEFLGKSRRGAITMKFTPQQDTSSE